MGEVEGHTYSTFYAESLIYNIFMFDLYRNKYIIFNSRMIHQHFGVQAVQWHSICSLHYHRIVADWKWFRLCSIIYSLSAIFLVETMSVNRKLLFLFYLIRHCIYRYYYVMWCNCSIAEFHTNTNYWLLWIQNNEIHRTTCESSQFLWVFLTHLHAGEPVNYFILKIKLKNNAFFLLFLNHTLCQ